MPDLEDGRGKRRAGVQQRLLDGRFRVPGKEEARLAVDHAQDDGGVVRLLRLRVAGKDVNAGRAEIEAVAHVGDDHAVCLLVDRADKAAEARRVILRHGAIDLVDRAGV